MRDGKKLQIKKTLVQGRLVDKCIVNQFQFIKKINSMKRLSSIAIGTTFLFMILGLNACSKNDFLEMDNVQHMNSSTNSRTSTEDVTYYALADNGTAIQQYTTNDPATSLNSATITGLQSGERILAFDFRPATGQLFGVGSTSRLYVINPVTGAATMIGAGPFSPVLAGGVTAFDFNPTVDRIRLVTGTGQNLRLNPNTGTVGGVDMAINGQPGAQIAGVAYTNNFAGATSTILYGIDIVSENLYKISPPNDGTLELVGPLVLNNMGEGGFDISGDIALGLFTVNKKSTLFTVDLATGSTTVLYKYKKDIKHTGIAIPIQ